MKKITVPFLSLIIVSFSVNAQSPEDALRTAWFIPGGTARNMGIGGAGGSLGGDISSANINPAGLGLYKSREFVFTPGIFLNNTKFNYRDSSSSVSKAAFSYGPIGYVAGALANKYSSWTSTAFSISVTQLASYNTHNHFSSNNNYSSFSEQWVEELTYNNTSPNDALFNFPLGSSLGYKTYLIDSTTANGGLEYISQVFKVAGGIHQTYDEQTTGGYHEISLGFAGNKNDRFYIGGSINIPYIHYSRTLNYREDDPTGNLNNDFSFFDYTQKYTSTGIGLNAKIGIIYKANTNFRMGFAVHTPSYIAFKDDYYASLTANTEKYADFPQATANSDQVISDNGLDPKGISRVDYAQTTPYRLIASGTYIITGSTLQQQKGFITADVEYVNYRSSRYYSTDDNNGSSAQYYDALNQAIKDYNKPAFNVRIGGELKYDTWLFRLGGAYYGSPYKDAELKASRMMASAGLGYRNHGFFVDLTFAQTINKDVYFPYRLSDKANTYAEGKNNRSNVVLTFGVKI